MAKTNKYKEEQGEFNLDGFEKQVMNAFLTNEFMTSAFLQKKYGHSRVTWFKKLHSLKEKGYLKKDQKTRGGTTEWYLTEKGEEFVNNLDNVLETEYQNQDGK